MDKLGTCHAPQYRTMLSGRQALIYLREPDLFSGMGLDCSGQPGRVSRGAGRLESKASALDRQAKAEALDSK
ncbi:hypothetical protein [uncultured Lamprocystis sp.]|jgi:hypothetical protein|uniref:hypothetical protein n=2 Tax=uncultured Lamprocystis sp. TaxID=543132 RepID=UPI0025DD921F|nr:hypothetical protein [uncultured Lamprocystis sp.]